MSKGRKLHTIDRAGLPDHPDLALFVATLFERLGGRLEIDRTGQRHARRPDADRLHGDRVPQLADATPAERFESRAEWDGAMKLAEYWLRRLSGADRDYVFALIGQAAVDENGAFDFRDRL